MVSLSPVSVVPVKIASCFSFSFAYCTGGKGPALQSFIPESVASFVVSCCVRMPYEGNINLSHKWPAS